MAVELFSRYAESTKATQRAALPYDAATMKKYRSFLKGKASDAPDASRSKGLLQDPSAPGEEEGGPFFVRDESEPVYTGFGLVKETETDGFIFGAITNYLEPDSEDGCTYGDGYIQAPDGSRAGIVWDVSDEPTVSTIIEPEERRWGVYAVEFPKPIKTTDDLVYNFGSVLPLLRQIYEDLKRS